MKDLTTGKESRIILYFATPMLLGNIFQQLYNVVDSIIVGNYLGKEALGAVGASFPIIFTLISFIIGIGSGGTIVIAQYFGARKFDMVTKAIDTLYIFFFFASFVLTATGIYFSEDIFKITQLPEEIIPQAKTYLNTYLIGLIAFFGFNGTSAILRGLGDSKTPLYFLIIASVFNIGFDFLFIVGFKWGIAGAAWATIIAQAGAFITAVLYLNKTHKIINLNLRTIKFDGSIFAKTIKIGLPSGFQHTFVALGMIAMFRIVNEFGTNVVAAYSVAGRIDSLAMLPAMNFAQALSTFVGQNLGANQAGRVKTGLYATFFMSSLVSLVLSIGIILTRTYLMDLFTNDANVIEIGAQYLIIVSSFYLIFNSMFLFSGVLRGAGDTIVPMFLTLMSLWLIRVPLAWFLSQRIGVTGIWWAIPIAWFTSMFLSGIYYLTGNWKKSVIVKHPVTNGTKMPRP